jgi:TonB family protein
VVLEEKKKEEKKQEEEIKKEKKSIKPKKNQGAGGMQGGGGDPRARVTHKGVLGIISGQIKGKSVASADIFGKGGFATDIDAILSGVGGLKSGGSGGVGRKGVAGIGYGAGYGSGFGGSGAGGIDDLIGGLMGGDGGGGLDLKKRGSLKITSAEFMKGAALTGGRSKASIMRVVMQNIAALRHAYNKRLREKPGLKGKITVKFAIDEYGKVIFCQIVESTMGDPDLESEVAAKIRRWIFEKIDKPGDVTEVVYPFVFSQ